MSQVQSCGRLTIGSMMTAIAVRRGGLPYVKWQQFLLNLCQLVENAGGDIDLRVQDDGYWHDETDETCMLVISWTR